MREFFFSCHQRPHHPRRCAADRAFWAASSWAPGLSLPGGARSLTGLRQARAAPGAYPLARARWSGFSSCCSRRSFRPSPPACASQRFSSGYVPPHTIAGIIYSLCATSAAAALKPSLIAARRSTHRVPCARGGGQPHSRTERRFWISAAREHSERTSRVLSLPRSRRHFAKSTVAL